MPNIDSKKINKINKGYNYRGISYWGMEIPTRFSE